jgi:hypothetical protein
VPRQGKRQLNVFVDEAAFEALRVFADEQGVSVTALINALGLVLGGVPKLSPTLKQLVERARQTDVERRRVR